MKRNANANANAPGANRMGNPPAARLRATNPRISEPPAQDVHIGVSPEAALLCQELVDRLCQELVDRRKFVWLQLTRTLEAEVAGSSKEFKAGYSQQDIRVAVHEAGHAVVAWAVGSLVEKITMEATNVERSPVDDQSGSYGVCRAETHIEYPFSHNGGQRSDVDIVAECAIAAAGSIALAAHCHKDIAYGFRSGGTDDFDLMLTTASASERPPELLRGFAIGTARALCNKYKLLIYEIASLLLKDREISREGFLSTIASHGLPLIGDPVWLMGVNPEFERVQHASRAWRNGVTAKEIHNEEAIDGALQRRREEREPARRSSQSNQPEHVRRGLNPSSAQDPSSKRGHRHV